MVVSEKKNIADFVTEDYRSAQVFKDHNIDFCCNGDRPFAEVCETEGVDKEKLKKELEEVTKKAGKETIDYTQWPLDLLADYVEKTHHRYVEKQSPILKQYLDKICQVHGDKHPELFEIKEEFNACAGEMASHQKKEEIMLFPFIRKMVKAKDSGQTELEHPTFNSVKNPIAKMMEEHDVEGERLRKISKLSDNYTPPADACNTYKVTFNLLEEYEDDMHKHVHLENNILFPKSADLEKEFNA